MFWIVLAILIVEIIRLLISIRDTRNVNSMNKRAEERQIKAIAESEQRDKEWAVIRHTEIEKLKELAKDSKFLEGLVAGLVEGERPRSANRLDDIATRLEQLAPSVPAEAQLSDEEIVAVKSPETYELFAKGGFIGQEEVRKTRLARERHVAQAAAKKKAAYDEAHFAERAKEQGYVKVASDQSLPPKMYLENEEPTESFVEDAVRQDMLKAGWVKAEEMK